MIKKEFIENNGKYFKKYKLNYFFLINNNFILKRHQINL